MQTISIHSVNPQPRLVAQAAAAIAAGQVIIYPTDSCYALGCSLTSTQAEKRIRKIRKLAKDHYFTLVCSDLSAIGTYAQIHNPAFRLIKSLIPGPYTFILPVTREVPKKLWHTKRKTLGFRIPDNKIANAIAQAYGEPILSTSLHLPGSDLPLYNPYDIIESLHSQVDLFIDAGIGGVGETTVLAWEDFEHIIIRQGIGEI